MSRIEKLLQELSPDGVEYVEINDVCKVITSKVKIKSHDYIKHGLFPVIDQGQKFIGGYTNNAGAFPEDKYIIFGDHTCVVKYIDFAFFQGADGVKVLKANQNIINTKYLFYCMSNIHLEVNYSRHWSKMRIHKIPLPPLEIQEEIVRILDNFTELTAELTLRKKQYEYYRDYLLDFGDDVEYKSLGEIAAVTKLAGFEFTSYVRYSDEGKIIALRGLNVKDGHLVLDDVKYIDNSDFSKLNRSKLFIDDILFTYVGTVGQVALINENNRFYLAPNVALIRLNDKFIIPKFIMFYFQSSHLYKIQIKKLLQNSSLKNLTMEKIRKFVIPVPPIEEQERIVNILDRFDKLCNDISEGLPAEIEARKKQYEYYRDKLLSL